MRFFKKAGALWMVLILFINMFSVSGACASKSKELHVVKDSGVMSDEDIWSSLQPLEKRIVGDTTLIDAGFNVTWDNSNMYVAVQVTSTVDSQASFDGGGISYYLSPKNNRGAYANDDFQVQIKDDGQSVTAGYSGSGKNASLKVSDISVKYESIANGYTMKIKMPWSVVGMVPHDVCNMGFDIMAFSSDDDCVMAWSGTADDWTDTSDFGTLIFTGDGTEPNGQTLTADRYIYGENTEIGMCYTKAAENDEVCIVPKDGNPGDELLGSKNLQEGSGRIVYSAQENMLQSGDYEALLYNPDNGAVYARTAFTIGEVKVWTEQPSYLKQDKTSITVHYANAAAGSWIGIYHEGSTPGSSNPSLVWRYTDPDSNEMTFTTDDFLKSTHSDFLGGSQDYLKSGSYEAILFADGNYDIDQICPFTVTGPQLTLKNKTFPTNFEIKVDYSGTDAVNNLDWVGIYKKGAVPASSTPTYAYRYATGDSGTLSFTQQDVKDYQYSPLNGAPLPEGDYELILMANDGYNILDRIGFCIKDCAVYAPTAVSYDRGNARTGYADGTVTITDTDHKTTTQYVLYWGDANGKLNKFNSIDTVMRTGDITKYHMATNTFIPNQATRLLVYASNGTAESDTPVSFEIPADKKFTNDAPLYTFNVISDTHVASWDSSTVNTDLAFKDIKKNDPKSSGIFLVGDVVDSGIDSYYDKFLSVIDANKEGLPKINFAIGNHEFMETTNNPYGHSVDGKMQKWLDHTKESNVYYDQYINGQHFIVMGSEQTSYDDDDCYISETQFNWLRQKLAETKNKKEPIFLFLHQSMSNTVAGSIGIKGTPGAQGWYGMKPEQEAELRDILKDYPQVTLFNGHSHWILESNHEMYDGKSSFPSIFNTAAVGYLWNDAQQYVEGGEGLYLEVYKDKILIKGRNFTTDTWIPKAFFTVDLNEKYKNIPDNNTSNGNNPDNSSSKDQSDHSSQSSSNSPKDVIGSGSSITRTTSSIGETTISVAAKPETAPSVSGGKSSVSVVVPQDAIADFSSATASKPVNLKIAAPESALLEQMNNNDVHSVSLTIQVPSQAINNTNANIKVAVDIPSAVVQAAKTLKKDIVLQVNNSQTGKLAYSWTFSGAALSNSASPVISVDTTVTVDSIKNSTSAAKIVGENSTNHQASGTLLHFAGNGLLPALASVRVYVGDKDGCLPNSKVYLYYLNRNTEFLEQLPKSEFMVDADGYVTVPIMHCSDYVLIPQAATVPYPVKSDTTYPVVVKKGKTYTFAMTVTGNAVPTFSVGNGKIFKTSVKHLGSKYFFTVQAVGNPGEKTAVYSTLPKKKAVPMGYLAVA